MTETLVHIAPEKTAHPDWNMEVRHDELETEEDLLRTIESRLHVFGDQERAQEGKVTGFIYDPAEYDTHLELSDNEGNYYDVDASLPDFLEDRDNERPDAWQVRQDILADISSDYMNRHVQPTWWHDIDSLMEHVDTRLLRYGKPTEQLIIGQRGRGVRFFNYGEQMSEARIEDCRKFIDILTAYFGDRVYDLMTDVIIVSIDQERRLDRSDTDGDTDGFVPNGPEGVVVVNAALLAEDRQMASSRLDDEGVTRLLEVLVHEFGHLLHGNDPEAEKELLAFAKEVGWDVDAMLEQLPNWRHRGQDLSPFVPSDDLIMQNEDGSKERIPLVEYYDRYENDYDDEGHVLNPGKPYTQLGSPSGYGEKNPQETFADSTAYALLGNWMMRVMPETRDAWLRHAEKRAGQPLATPIDRAPIVVDHRKASDIVYPVTPLPETIFVRAVPRPAR